MKYRITFKQAFKWWLQVQILTYLPFVILFGILTLAGWELKQNLIVNVFLFVVSTIWGILAFKINLESFSKGQLAERLIIPDKNDL